LTDDARRFVCRYQESFYHGYAVLDIRRKYATSTWYAPLLHDYPEQTCNVLSMVNTRAAVQRHGLRCQPTRYAMHINNAKELDPPPPTDLTAPGVKPCRYYAPDLSRLGQYNTMVSCDPACAAPSVGSFAACVQLASRLPCWTCLLAAEHVVWSPRQFGTCLLQVQGESWRVNAGANRLVPGTADN
jgi:hypothetical protein